MSEANTPSNSGLPESIQPKPDWDALALEKRLPEGGASPSIDIWDDWETVDFPDALSVDAIAQTGAAPAPALEATESETDCSEPPPVDELVQLIQELNQCNTLLLERVAQLEASLEQSDRALQTELSRTQAFAAEHQTLTSAQERVLQLINELEFAQQTSQRQQILVETLTGQLETSQERVAQLERECALVQQRHNEQAQLLMESENACRDLRSRLQRQQRYTLQFKAALDKCLDVPPPRYEAGAEPIAAVHEPVSVGADAIAPAEAIGNLTAQPFLPRVARIQPWTSHPRFELNLHDADQDRFSIDRLRTVSGLEQRLGQFGDAETDAQESDFDIDPAEAAIDMSARLDRQITTAAQQLAAPLTAIDPDVPYDLAPPASSDAPEVPPSDDDALWQDLARLIEVSTEDVVRASQSEDFAEFESPQSVSEQGSTEPIAASPGVDDQPAIDLADTIAAAVQKSLHLPTPQPTQSSPAAAPAANSPALHSNWPSPVVYPLRPTRKLRSLAAVDLPTFPKPNF